MYFIYEMWLKSDLNSQIVKAFQFASQYGFFSLSNK